MAVKVVQFNISSTDIVGTIVPITTIGFRPSGVFFRWSGANATVDTGPTRATIMGGEGYMLNNGKRGCISYYMQDNADPYQAGSGIWNDQAIVRQTGNTTTGGRADFYQFTSSGFEYIIDEQFGATITVICWAFSGVEMDAIEVTEPGGTGIQSYSTPFRATFLKVLGSGRTSYNAPAVHAQMCIGAAHGTGADQNAVWSYYEEAGLGFADTAEYCRRTECLAINNASAVITRAKLNGFASNAVELDWVERSGSRKFLLIVATGRWHVAVGTTRTDGVPFTSTGMTWKPEGVEVVSGGAPESALDTVTTSDLLCSVGFGTGPTERMVIVTRHNFDGNTLASRQSFLHEFDEVYGNVTNAATPATDALMDINSAFALDTIEWIMDDPDPSARFFFAIVLGPPIVEFRKRLVKYQHNTYESRAAGKTLVRDVLGRRVPMHEIQSDNWLFSGGAPFVSPVKHRSLLQNPAVFYVESVSPTEAGVSIETNRETMFSSIMRRLAG